MNLFGGCGNHVMGMLISRENNKLERPLSENLLFCPTTMADKQITNE